MRTFTIVLVLFCFFFTLTAYSQSKVSDEIKDRRFYQQIEKMQRFAPHSQALHKMMDQHLLLDNYVRQSNYGEGWENQTRTEFKYQNGLITQELNLRYLEGIGWENNYRRLHSHSGNQVAESVGQSWNSGSEEWINSYQELFGYQTVNGNQVLSIVEINEWNNGEWQPEMKIEIDFSGGTFNSFLSSWWHAGMGEWIPLDRAFLTEDAGNLIITDEEWDGSDWVPEYRTIYPGLTKNGFYDLVITELESITFGSWLYFMYKLDLPEFTEQYWDEDEWINDWRMRRETAKVNASASSVLKFIFEYYDEGLGWLTDEIIEFETSATGVLEKATEYYVDFEGVVFADFMEEYLYDSSTNHLERINQYELYNGDSELFSRILLEWGTATSITDSFQRPETFKLGNAYPNPFNPSTMIPYRMAASGHASIRVFDMLGRQVAVLVDEVIPMGEHTVQFDASRLSSGVYIVRFETAGNQFTRKVTLLK